MLPSVTVVALVLAFAPHAPQTPRPWALGSSIRAQLQPESLQPLPPQRPPQKLRRVREQLGAGFRTLVAAVVLVAVPRGPARAAELDAPSQSSVVLELSGSGAAPLPTPGQQLEIRSTLLPMGPGSKSPGTGLTDEMFVEEGSGGVDLNDIVGEKGLQRYMDDKFLFQDTISAKGAIEEEFQDLAIYKANLERNGGLKTAASAAVAAGCMYGVVQAGVTLERFVKADERREREKEIRLTGSYISVDASDVETVIDPKTGKNITIASSSKPDATDAAVAAAAAAAAASEMPKSTLGILWQRLTSSLGSSDEDFWAPYEEPDPLDAAVDAVDAEAAAAEAEAAGKDEDTDGLDALDGLLS